MYMMLNEDERVFHEYFRVAFYGAAFPPAIRVHRSCLHTNLPDVCPSQNKEFIYRGFDFERIAEFISRMQTRYPKAEMLKFTERPPPAYYTADKMCMHLGLSIFGCNFRSVETD